MRKIHPNEIIKLKYREFLKHADGKADATIRRIEKSVDRYEVFTRRADFRTFRKEDALRYKDFLSKSEIRLATLHTTLSDLTRFFLWLSQQPGYRKNVAPSDAAYFKLTDRAVRAATAAKEKPYHSLASIRKAVSEMPAKNSVDLRNRAAIVFLALTGIRDGAFVSLKIKHFDRERMLVLQDPSEVNTKFRKRIDTFLFPLCDEFESIFIEWLDFLEAEGYSEEDPLFPQTNVGQDDDNCFVNDGLSKSHWKTTGPVRKLFQEAFGRIGEKSHGPHSFRRTIVSEMYNRNLSIAEFKAWSQNLGHEGVMTTLTSYGKINLEEQGRLVRPKKRPQKSEQLLTRSDLEEFLEKLVPTSELG